MWSMWWWPRRRRREVEGLQDDVEGRAVGGACQLHDDDDGGVLARRAGDDGVPFRGVLGATPGVLPPPPGECTVVVRHHLESVTSGSECEPLVDRFDVGIEGERCIERAGCVERLVPDVQVGRRIDPWHLGALERGGSEVDVVPVLGHGDAQVAGGIDERVIARGQDEVVRKVGRGDDRDGGRRRPGRFASAQGGRRRDRRGRRGDRGTDQRRRRATPHVRRNEDSTACSGVLSASGNCTSM